MFSRLPSRIFQDELRSKLYKFIFRHLFLSLIETGQTLQFCFSQMIQCIGDRLGSASRKESKNIFMFKDVPCMAHPDGKQGQLQSHSGSKHRLGMTSPELRLLQACAFPASKDQNRPRQQHYH